jgi:hypothetical protein
MALAGELDLLGQLTFGHVDLGSREWRPGLGLRPRVSWRGSRARAAAQMILTGRDIANSRPQASLA